MKGVSFKFFENPSVNDNIFCETIQERAQIKKAEKTIECGIKGDLTARKELLKAQGKTWFLGIRAFFGWGCSKKVFQEMETRMTAYAMQYYTRAEKELSDRNAQLVSTPTEVLMR